LTAAFPVTMSPRSVNVPPPPALHGDQRAPKLAAQERPDSSGPARKSCKEFQATGMLEEEPGSGPGGGTVRGRKPRPLTLAPADLPILQAVARSRRLAWFQVQHARIALAVASGEPVQAIAARLECDPATV
jgi:hypothetical protein